MQVARTQPVAGPSKRLYGVISKSSRRLRSISSSSNNEDRPDGDVDPIPNEPTWSVHELISSYPRPQISSETLTKLHKLSALVPPIEGTKEHARMKRELEEMVRLVEAVRLVDVTALEDGVGEEGDTGIPDGRIWPEGEGMALSPNALEGEFNGEEGEHGRALLKYASWTKNGLYVVEADRRKK